MLGHVQLEQRIGPRGIHVARRAGFRRIRVQILKKIKTKPICAVFKNTLVELLAARFAGRDFHTEKRFCDMQVKKSRT